MKKILPLIATVFAVVLLVFSCVGFPAIEHSPPLWITSPPRGSSTDFVFRSIAIANNLEQARNEVFDDIISQILDKMNLGEVSGWKFGGRLAVEAFMDNIQSAVLSPDFYEVKGMKIQNLSAWKKENDIAYALELLWDSIAFGEYQEELIKLTGTVYPDYTSLEDYAKRAISDGNIYEAALMWASVAGNAEILGNTLDYHRAMGEAEKVLKELEYKVISVPKTVYIGESPVNPIRVQVQFQDKPIGNADFIISYIPVGEEPISQKTVYVSSDAQGYVLFQLPAALKGGTQRLDIAIASEPFLRYLHNKETDAVVLFAKNISTPHLLATYNVGMLSRAVPTGVMILETDLTGNPLRTDFVASGTLDKLLVEGFNAEILPSSSQSISSQGNAGFLKYFQSNKDILSHYQRVIYGVVHLESFEQDGDSFSVKVSGALFFAEIQSGAILYRSSITKTSRASDGQQAINAAFRQLGRSFAAEISGRTL